MLIDHRSISEKHENCNNIINVLKKLKLEAMKELQESEIEKLRNEMTKQHEDMKRD